MQTYIVRVKLHREEDGRWSVAAPDLPGCVSWGYTEEEALANIQDAANLYIESLIQLGQPIPPAVRPTAEPAVTVNVSAA